MLSQELLITILDENDLPVHRYGRLTRTAGYLFLSLLLRLTYVHSDNVVPNRQKDGKNGQ